MQNDVVLLYFISLSLAHNMINYAYELFIFDGLAYVYTGYALAKSVPIFQLPGENDGLNRGFQTLK